MDPAKDLLTVKAPEEALPAVLADLETDTRVQVLLVQGPPELAKSLAAFFKDLGPDEAEVRQMLDVSRHPMSLEAPVGSDGDAFLGDVHDDVGVEDVDACAGDLHGCSWSDVGLRRVVP